MEGFLKIEEVKFALQTLHRYLNDSDIVEVPIITSETLKRLPSKAIKELNPKIHQHYNPKSNTSRIPWSDVMWAMHTKVGEKAKVFDDGLFEYVRKTYEENGKYVVTHECDDTNGKHYVIFQHVEKDE